MLWDYELNTMTPAGLGGHLDIRLFLKIPLAARTLDIAFQLLQYELDELDI